MPSLLIRRASGRPCPSNAHTTISLSSHSTGETSARHHDRCRRDSRDHHEQLRGRWHSGDDTYTLKRHRGLGRTKPEHAAFLGARKSTDPQTRTTGTKTRDKARKRAEKGKNGA